MPPLKKPKKIKQAITLIELIVVIVIIAIVAVFSIPQFTKTFEATRARQALAALRQIRTGERIYRIKEEFYYPYSKPSGGSEDNPDKIYTTLKVLLDKSAERNWDFKIETEGKNLDNFIATGTRKSGVKPYRGGMIKINQDGKLWADKWPLPLPEE